MAPAGRSPDTPGWQVRVVPNLYPALDHQEVVVHTPRHARSIAELTDEELGAVAMTWHARLGASYEKGLEFQFLFVNEGRAAGASLAHSHSQIAWLRQPAHEEDSELPRLRRASCALCEIARHSELLIAVSGNLSLRVASAGRVPYELLIAPTSHEPKPTTDGLEDALKLMREGVRRLYGTEGPVPFNAWLHQGAHWHFELLPRLSVFAGLELGAGIYVNWLPPEEAAARLRAV